MKNRSALSCAWLLFQAGVLCAAPTPREEPLGPANQKRQAAVQRCAQCHADIYAAWKAGPHARAYLNLPEQWKKAFVSALPELERKKLQSSESIRECLSCHSPSRNVFDASILPSWDGQGKVDYKELKVGEDEEVMTGGVDCMTCHADGARVVTRSDYRPPAGFQAPPGFCDPKPSLIFSHISGCISCHENVVKTYAHRFQADPLKRKEPFLSCNDCHMEHDSQGRRHHYYFREGDDKKVEKLVRPLFDRFAIKVRGSSTGRMLDVRWPMDSVPHPVIPYDTPKIYVVKVELTDSAGTAVFSRTVRFYAPSEDWTVDVIKKLNPTEKKDRNPTDELVASEALATFARSYKLPAGMGESGSIRLTVLKKSSPDSADMAARVVYRRESTFGMPAAR